MHFLSLVTHLGYACLVVLTIPTQVRLSIVDFVVESDTPRRAFSGQNILSRLPVLLPASFSLASAEHFPRHEVLSPMIKTRATPNLFLSDVMHHLALSCAE